MNKEKIKQNKRLRRKARVRARVFGTAQKPRLCVFRSNAGMYLQLINDEKGVTLASAYSKEIKSKGNKTELSLELGKLLAQKAAEKKIKKVVFDKNGYRYHGRVASAAQGARDGGLEF